MSKSLALIILLLITFTIASNSINSLQIVVTPQKTKQYNQEFIKFLSKKIFKEIISSEYYRLIRNPQLLYKIIYSGRYISIKVGNKLKELIGEETRYIHVLAYNDLTGWFEVPVRIYDDCYFLGPLKYYVVPEKITQNTRIEIKLPLTQPTIKTTLYKSDIEKIRKYARGSKGYFLVTLTDKKLGKPVAVLYVFYGSHIPNKFIIDTSIDTINALNYYDIEYFPYFIKAYHNIIITKAKHYIIDNKHIRDLIFAIIKDPLDQSFYSLSINRFLIPIPDGGIISFHTIIEHNNIVPQVFPAKTLTSKKKSIEFTVEPYDTKTNYPVDLCEEFKIKIYLINNDLYDLRERTVKIYINDKLYKTYTVILAGTITITKYFVSSPLKIKIEIPDITDDKWNITVSTIAYLNFYNVEYSKINKPMRVYIFKDLSGKNNYLRMIIPYGSNSTEIVWPIPNPFMQIGVLSYTPSNTIEINIKIYSPGNYPTKFKIMLGNKVLAQDEFTGTYYEKTFRKTISTPEELYKYIEEPVPIPLVLKLETPQLVEDDQEYLVKISMNPTYLKFYARPMTYIKTGNNVYIYTSSIGDNDPRWVNGPILSKERTYATLIFYSHVTGTPDTKACAVFAEALASSDELVGSGNSIDLNVYAGYEDIYPNDLGDYSTKSMGARVINVSLYSEFAYFKDHASINVVEYSKGWGSTLPHLEFPPLIGTIGSTIAVKMLERYSIEVAKKVSLVLVFIGVAFDLWNLMTEEATNRIEHGLGEHNVWVAWIAGPLAHGTDVKLKFIIDNTWFESYENRNTVYIRVNIYIKTNYGSTTLSNYARFAVIG